MVEYWNSFLTATRIKICVIKLSAIILPQYNLLLNAISIKKTCDKAIDTCPFVVDSVHDQYVTQEMCDKVVSKELIIPKCCPD